MLARILLVINILIFLVLVRPCTTGMPLVDHRPAITAAENQEDAKDKEDISLGIKCSGMSILVSLAFVIAQPQRPRK